MSKNWNCCGFKFNSSKNYMIHLNEHKLSKNLIVTCNLCGQYTQSWEAFRKHNQRYHSKSEINKVFEINYTANFPDNDTDTDDSNAIVDNGKYFFEGSFFPYDTILKHLKIIIVNFFFINIIEQ